MGLEQCHMEKEFLPMSVSTSAMELSSRTHDECERNAKQK